MVRFAVVGVRNFARTHINNLLKLRAEGAVDITSVVIADQVANAGQVEWVRSKGIEVFDSFDSLLRDGRGQFDIPSLPVSIPTHAPMAIKAMEAGYNVLVEKPPAPTIQELDSMISVSSRTGKFCAVGFQFIHSRTIRRLKEMICAGELGEIIDISCKAYWPRYSPYYHRNGWAGKTTVGGRIVLDGPINNALAHYLNNMLFLASNLPDQEAEIESVEAELYRGHTYIEAEDTSCLRVRCTNGASIHFYVTHCSPYELNPYMEITATNGRVVWHMNEETTVTLKDGRVIKFNNEGVDPWLEVFRVSARAYTGELDKPYCRVDNCRSFVLTINGAYESSRGVHRIPDQFVRESVGANGVVTTVVEGITDAMDRAFAERKLLSEIGVEWAVPTELFPMKGYKEFKLPVE